MSSVKCVGMVAAAGAALAGGVSAYRGMKVRNRVIADAQKFSDAHGGKIPVGGMTKDGKMWDGFTTVENIKKDSKKKLVVGTAINTVAAGAITAAISALTLFAKAKIK